MDSRRKIVSFAIIALLSLSSIPLLQLNAANQVPLYGGTAVVEIGSDPTRLEPTTTNFNSQIVWFQIYETLLRYNASGVPQPLLASSWTVSSDGLTITFNLVKNATWTDGTKLTSADVKFSYLSILDKFDFAPHLLLDPVLKSIDTPDNYTVVFHLSSPMIDPTWVFAWGGIFPQHLWASNPNPANNTALTITNPVGSGPYELKEWVHGDHLTLVKNPNYWRSGLPYMDSIVFKVTPDATSRVLALQTGAANLIVESQVPLSSFSQLLGLADGHAGTANQAIANDFSIMYISSNNKTQIAPLLNEKVRQAINFAVDRTAHAQTAWYGVAQPAVSMYSSPSVAQYQSAANQKIYPLTANVTMANQLLDQAGYPKQANGTRFSVSLDVTADRPAAVAQAALIQSELKAVGINVLINALDEPTYFAHLVTTYSYQMSLGYLCIASPIGVGGDCGLSAWYGNNISPGAFGENYQDYKNASYDAMYNKFLTTTDPAQRLTEIHQLEHDALLQGGIVFLTVAPGVYASRGLNNYPVDDLALDLAHSWLSTGTTRTTTTSSATTSSSGSAATTTASASTTASAASSPVTTTTLVTTTNQVTTTVQGATDNTALYIGAGLTVIVVIAIAAIAIGRRRRP